METDIQKAIEILQQVERDQLAKQNKKAKKPSREQTLKSCRIRIEGMWI